MLKRAPIIALFVLVGLNLLCYSPVRVGAVGERADLTNRIFRAPERAHISKAVVFARMALPALCRERAARGWVFWRPNSDPWFEDDIVWANHITVDIDKRLMRSFPDRKGYIVDIEGLCTVTLTPLDEADPQKIRPGVITRSGPNPGIPAPPP